MSSFDGIARRVVDDPAFAAAVRANPAAALAGHRLTHEELRNLDRLIRGRTAGEHDDPPTAAASEP